MEYGITANGFSMRRLDEIYNASCKRFEDEIGVNPSENPQSVMNLLPMLSLQIKARKKPVRARALLLKKQKMRSLMKNKIKIFLNKRKRSL